jgi:hypothetical protein
MSKQSNANVKRNKRLAKLRERAEKTNITSNGSLSSQVKELEAKITNISEVLAKNLKSFSEAFSQNLQIIKQSFYATDVHLEVLQRICQDLITGKVQASEEASRFITEHPEITIYEGPNAIDFGWYYKQVEEDREKRLAESKEEAKKLEESKNVEVKEESINSPTPPDEAA